MNPNSPPAAEEFAPHHAVHRPWMFICGENPDDSVVAFDENPARQIASDLLEEIGDWHHAIKNLQRESVPPPVVAALDTLHDAVCGWVDWNDTLAAKTQKPGPRPDPPQPPHRAA